MKCTNPTTKPLCSVVTLYKLGMVLLFVWFAGCAFQESEFLVGLISLIMAVLTPSIDNLGGESDE